VKFFYKYMLEKSSVFKCMEDFFYCNFPFLWFFPVLNLRLREKDLKHFETYVSECFKWKQNNFHAVSGYRFTMIVKKLKYTGNFIKLSIKKFLIHSWHEICFIKSIEDTSTFSFKNCKEGEISI
jgi:hypothetical protein